MAARQRTRVGSGATLGARGVPFQGAMGVPEVRIMPKAPLPQFSGTEAATAYQGQASTPMQPRIWTPKVQQAERVSAAAALAQEMQELESTEPHGCATISLGPPSFSGSPQQAYKTSYYNTTCDGSSGSLSGAVAGLALAVGAAGTAASAAAAAAGSPAGRGSSPGGRRTAEQQQFSASGARGSSSSGGNSPAGSCMSSCVGARPGAIMQNNLMASDSRGSGSGDEMGPAVLAKMLRRSRDRTSHVEAYSEPSLFSSQPLPANASNRGTSSPQPRRPTPPPRPVSSLCGTSAAAWEAEVKRLLAAGDQLGAVLRPGPSLGVGRCYIRRQKPLLLGGSTSFQVFTEAGHTLLLAARRRVKSSSSSYVISLDPGELSKDSPSIIGKLKADFVGTEYTLWLRGGNSGAHKGFGSQALAVNYKPSVKSVKGGPRTMMVALPVPEEQGWVQRAPVEGPDSLAGCLERARQRCLPPSQERCLSLLHTMQPLFDSERKVHYLDFKGRVTQSSTKNCQLVHWDHNSDQLGSDLVLLFGSKGQEEYALDFAYPLSLMQALAIALSSIDTKLCNTI